MANRYRWSWTGSQGVRGSNPLSSTHRNDHPAYDDPEWAADAAHGVLTPEYGLRATYADMTEVDTSGLDEAVDG